MVKTSSGDRFPLAAKRPRRLLQRAAGPLLRDIDACTAMCNNRHIAPLQKYLEGHNYGRTNEKSGRTFCQPDARAEKYYSCDG
jgi:hypothetical protein